MALENSRKDYDYLFKLVLIGDSGVGKSSLLLRFADSTFTDSYISTIGVDFRFRTVKVDNSLVKLQIWDTAGQERFRTITSAYYRGADGVIIVFDVASKQSYESTRTWLGEVERVAGMDIVKVIVGNKCDIEKEKWEVTKESVGNKDNILWTSAKSNEGVEDVFVRIAKELIKKKQALDKGRERTNVDTRGGNTAAANNVKSPVRINQRTNLNSDNNCC